ncbi:hypothetical protein DACRYDRAFT_16925 [Dacryopinax primogenitus]|uniref:Uncharacterized protein n=1 Tax=Dacryopinax primogenitus (strain DJM 731) TaxID=1858805 RepID=M5FVU4_DACPD|nr:uncharacterized protein DACRYDRAFT_16925 [Dacryopinax primogenitus]EJU00479.1 hypothetical protein DACRYDRAFT_16925 [Dacryopinax primogenitus]
MASITAAQSAAMKSSRILKSTLAGYDQITVVTQGAINFQLAAFPALYPGLEKVDVVDNDSSSTSQQVNYMITVANDGGVAPLNTFSWWSGFGKNSTQHTVSANDWQFTFTVDLSLDPATEDQDIPLAIRNQILQPGDYSVLKLVFDFTTANIVTNSVASVTPGLTDTYGKTQLSNMWQDWITTQTQSTNGNNSVLGYIMTTNANGATPNGQWGTAPTVPPTSLKFQNLGYIDPTTGTADPSGAPSPVGDNNMLVYLEMTQKHSFPGVGLLQPLTNWVIPPTANEPALDGLMVLGKNVFLEGWLLPQLQTLNSLTAVTMLSANWSWDVKVISCYYSFTWTQGVTSGTNTAWQLDTSADNTSSINYIWNYTSKQGDDHTDISQTHTTIGSTSVTNKISVPWGLNDQGQTSDYSASWSCKLVFASVQAGGLNITQSPASIVPSVSGSVDDTLFHHGSLDGITDAISGSLKALPISQVASACHLLLNGPWGFHFSGGNTFYMQGVEFNKEGDLTVDLSYKTQ